MSKALIIFFLFRKAGKPAPLTLSVGLILPEKGSSASGWLDNIGATNIGQILDNRGCNQSSWVHPNSQTQPAEFNWATFIPISEGTGYFWFALMDLFPFDILSSMFSPLLDIPLPLHNISWQNIECCFSLETCIWHVLLKIYF